MADLTVLVSPIPVHDSLSKSTPPRRFSKLMQQKNASTPVISASRQPVMVTLEKPEEDGAGESSQVIVSPATLPDYDERLLSPPLPGMKKRRHRTRSSGSSKNSISMQFASKSTPDLSLASNASSSSSSLTAPPSEALAQYNMQSKPVVYHKPLLVHVPYSSDRVRISFGDEFEPSTEQGQQQQPQTMSSSRGWDGTSQIYEDIALPLPTVRQRAQSMQPPRRKASLGPLPPPPPLLRPTTFWKNTRRSGVTGASYSPSSHLIRRSTFIAAGLSFEKPVADISAFGVESRVTNIVLAPQQELI